LSNAIASITLCDVPITPINQLDFATITEQLNYFTSKAKVTINKCKYQSRTATIRVKGYVDTLQNCNYGFYTNTYNGTSKTFYFWIVAKNFLARETTELTIQLDVFQTWLFDFHFNSCMVERKHVEDDTFGKHTIPEDFELGDYVTYTKKTVDCLTGNPCFFIGLTDIDSGTLGGIFGRTYSGFAIKYFSYENINALSSFITDLCTNGKADSIAFIFSFPYKLFYATYPELTANDGSYIGGIEGIVSALETFNWNEQKNNFPYNGDTYVPHNAKLFCYPFNFITVKNANGGNVVLKLENFSDSSDVEFLVESVVTQNPTITLTPKNYCNKAFAIDDSIAMSDYGLCSWNNDNFANWFANNRNSIDAQSANAVTSFNANKTVAGNNYNNALENRDTQMQKGVINTAISTLGALGHLNFFGAAANAVGGGANTYLDYQQNTRNANNDLSNNNLLNKTNYQNTIRSIVASVKDAQVQPNTSKGSTSSCGLDLARSTATFFIEQVGIKPEYARIIDMYFQIYGYQVNSVEVPKFNTRTLWNYLKTVNCSVYGNIPREDCDNINDMFNNGLTIWHGESNMYNYDAHNDGVGL
jgi:hypothetical protein